MGRRGSRSRLRCLAVVALACCSLTAATAGLALCRADDGCVSVEIAHGASRCETEQQRHHGEPVSFSSDCLGGTHGCSDLRIGMPVASTTREAWRAVPPAAAAAPPSFAHVCAAPPPWAIGWRAAITSHPLPSPAFLRAVKLLI